MSSASAVSSSTTRMWGAESFTGVTRSLLANERRGRVVALRPVIAHRHAVHQEMHILGNVGAVVADALDILGGEQQMRAQSDVARVFHHVGEQLAEQGIVHGIDALVV